MQSLEEPFAAYSAGKPGIDSAGTTSQDQSATSMLYTALPQTLQRCIPRIPSVRRKGLSYMGVRGHDRTASASSIEAPRTPPPAYKTRPATPAETRSETVDSVFSGGASQDMAIRHAALALALQRTLARPDIDTGIDCKTARHGRALLEMAAMEQVSSTPDDELSRRLYIDGMGYLLRSLPSTLTFEEEVALRAALPKSLARDVAPGFYSTRTLPEEDENIGPRPLIHRVASTSALYIFLAISIALPYLQYLTCQAYAFNRKHKLSDRVLASACSMAQLTTSQVLALAALVWDLNDGQVRKAVGGLGVWLFRDVSGGTHEGIMEAIRRLRLEDGDGIHEA